MSRLLRIFLSLVSAVVFFLSSSSISWAITKGGINIGDHYHEFPLAARSLSDGSWIYVMGCPGDAAKIFQYASQFPGKNLVIRGDYPGTLLTPKFAKAWVVALGEIPNNQFPNKIYFIPVNEPNHPRLSDYPERRSNDHVDARDLVKYINTFSTALSDSGLRAKRVKLLSPMFDVHYFMDHLNQHKQYIKELGGFGFFQQFDGIAFNLYGVYAGGAPFMEVPPIKRGLRESDDKGFGYQEFMQTYYGVNKPVFAVESGVTAAGAVKYKEYAGMIEHFYGQYAGSVWARDDNFIMFSIFSYDPLGDFTPWIYDEDGVISAIESVQGGRMPEAAQSLDETQYKSWRNSVEVKLADFVCQGKSKDHNIIDTSITEKTNSDPIILEYKKGIWELGGVNLGTVRLVNEDGEYKFESYDDIAKHTQMANEALLPSEAKDKMVKPSDEQTRLPGQPTYRVCEVTDAIGNPLEVDVVTKGGFSYQTPPEYGQGLYFGKFLQAIFSPGQSATGDEVLVKPAEKSEEERNQPLSSCPGKKGMKEEGEKEPEALENETVVRPSSSGVGDFFKKIICEIPTACDTIRIRLEATHFLAGAKTFHNEYSNPSSGFVNTQVPIEVHQQDSLVPQKIEAKNQLPVVPPATAGFDIGGQQPQSLSSLQGISVSLKDIGVPWAASVRDGFDYMLCSFMPAEFIERNKCKEGQTTDVFPKN